MMRLAPFADSVFVESTDRKSFSITTDEQPASVVEAAQPAPVAEAPRTRPKPHAKAMAAHVEAKGKPSKVPHTPRPRGEKGETSRDIVRQFLANGEPVKLSPIREELTRRGYQRNAASSVMLHLVQAGEVKRIGEATYQNVLREPASAAG